MTLNEVEIQKLIRTATANVISEKDLNRLAKKLSRKFEKNGLKSPIERIILIACILYDDLPSRFFYINERVEELRREIKIS